MCGAQWHGSSPSHHFQYAGFRVGRVWEVVEGRQTSAADYFVKFGLHFGLHLRFTNDEQSGPLQGRLDSLAASAQHVTDDLLHLTI